jgi:chromosome segregation ATPase
MAAREKELAKAEAAAAGVTEEIERKQQKLEERLTTREEKLAKREEKLGEREQEISAGERALTEARGTIQAQQELLDRREQEIMNMRPPGEELVQARAKQLDAREQELNEMENELRARAERLEHKAVLRDDVDRLE